MTRIKRCPYCHATAHVLIDWDSKRINGYYGQYVTCTLCSAKTQTKQNADQAIDEWNHRTMKIRYNSLYFKGGGTFAEIRFRIA